jgi:HlyD family secretion protein
MEFIAFGTLVGTLLFFISNEKSNLTYIIPQISFYALAAFKILPALQQIYASIGQVKGNLSAFESIQNDLKNSLIFENKEDKLIKINEELYLEKSIRLNNVYFKYPNKKQYAINNLSMNIKSNSLVGLVGTSGSGKSTILDLILGIIPPNKGNVSIDDNILSKKNYQLWQKNIGLVSQDIFLTEGSIAENIAFGLNKKEINNNLLHEAIKLAQLEEIISSLEQGINTIIGERD